MSNFIIDLAVFDLDGTLLNDNKEITQNTITMLNELATNGVKICFASGRHSSMMSIYTKVFPMCDFLVSSNGAVVMDLKINKSISSSFLTKNDTIRILKYVNEKKMEYAIYTDEKTYFTSSSKEILKRFLNYEKLSNNIGYPVKLSKEAIEDFHNIERVEKIVIYQTTTEIQNQLSELCVQELPNTAIESTGDTLIAFLNKKVSKGLAVKSIMRQYHIKKSKVAVFGDYDNDLSMFEVGKYKIAVDNATEVVKNHANFITLSNNDEGVAYACYKMFIKNQ